MNYKVVKKIEWINNASEKITFTDGSSEIRQTEGMPSIFTVTPVKYAPDTFISDGGKGRTLFFSSKRGYLQPITLTKNNTHYAK